MTTVAGYPCTVRHLTADEGGGFLISFPHLPGCMSVGDTMAEAKKNAADAVASYLASCRKHNDPVPEPGSGGPASGKYLARLPKSLHAALIERTESQGQNHRTSTNRESQRESRKNHTTGTRQPLKGSY